MKTAVTTIGFLPWWPQNPYQILLKRELNKLGFRVIGNPPLPIWRILLRLDGLDIVHVHWPHGLYKTNFQFTRAILVLLLYRLIKNNIVWTVHELDAYESTHPRRDEWFRKFVCRLSRHIFVHGDHTRRELIATYHPRCPISLIHHGSYVGCYPDEIDQDKARAKLGLPEKAKIFLYFGYIKPYKGVEDLCHAFSDMTGTDNVLLIVGKPLNHAIKETIQHHVSEDDRIHAVLDYVADDAVQLYFRAADIVVFPFRRTQTSGSVMLSLSFGRPLIAPKVATLPEYLDEEYTFWFEAGDITSLKRALCRAQDADLASMGKAAYQRARELSWGPMAEVHKKAYKEICP